MASITQTCAVSGQKFIIDDQDQAFYKKMGVPVPTLCPNERQRRRLAWQNMYHLYWRECDGTGKKILSCLSPDKPYTVYDQAYWWSDNWSALDFGFEPDFTKPFFEQFETLLQAVPYPAMFTNYLDDENSDFTNFAGFDKDCYLIFHADMNRECLYGTGVKKCTNVVDVFNVFDSELCYECVDCRNCYDLKFSQDCENCSESWFLKDCIGCKHCFGCMNLRQAEYCLFNKKVSQTEYENFINKFNSGSHEAIQKLRAQFKEFQATQPHRHMQGYQNENCEGDHIFRSRDIKDCFDIQESRDMRYCERVYNGPNSDCYDIDQFGMKLQLCYEGGPIGQDCVNTKFAPMVYNGVDCSYIAFTFNSQNCFGCVGLHKGKNCLFNKSYTKQEYEELTQRMIAHMTETGEWGEYFPIALSPWAYNETIAQEYYPIDKPEAIKRNYKWKDDIVLNQAVDTSGTIQNNIPDNIADVDTSICQEVLKCEVTGRAFKIQPAEFEFYKKMQLPLPRLHPDVRQQQRSTQRAPRAVVEVKCHQCEQMVKTASRASQVLCETCYQNVIK